MNLFPLCSWQWRLLAPPHSWDLHRERLGSRIHQSLQEGAPTPSHAPRRPSGLCPPARSRQQRAERELAGRRLPPTLRPLQPVPALHTDGQPEQQPCGEDGEAVVVEVLHHQWKPCTNMAAQALLEPPLGSTCGFTADRLAFTIAWGSISCISLTSHRLNCCLCYK